MKQIETKLLIIVFFFFNSYPDVQAELAPEERVPDVLPRDQGRASEGRDISFPGQQRWGKTGERIWTSDVSGIQVDFKQMF